MKSVKILQRLQGYIGEAAIPLFSHVTVLTLVTSAKP
jgi:hypothetical protein